ncbi:MAG: ATP-binding protein, partial [Aggregatilineales bacterium]
AMPSGRKRRRCCSAPTLHLDQMAAALGSALEGAPCVVCVQGPAGASKNAALQEAILRLKQQRSELDVWILSGRVSGADAPLGLMRDLLQTALRAWLRRNASDATPAETARRANARINEAVRLLPELRAAFGELQPLPLQPSPDETAALPLLRRRLFHALLHAIQTLTEGQPVVVVLNDLDDADDGSKEAVAWWLHMLVGSASPLALTFRQPPAALEPALAELRARRPAPVDCACPRTRGGSGHRAPASSFRRAGRSNPSALRQRAQGRPGDAAHDAALSALRAACCSGVYG